MRKIILGIGFICVFALGAREATCQCKCPSAVPGSKHLSAYEALKTSDAVFVGEVGEIVTVATFRGDGNDVPYEYEVKFKVKRAWKKSLTEIIAVRTYAGGCRLIFDKGKEYIVYAYTVGNMLRTAPCSRTRPSASAAEDLREFQNKGERPVEFVVALPSGS